MAPRTETPSDTTAVAGRLRPALLKLNRELRRELHDLGVTGGQASLLSEIGRHAWIGLGELAMRERMSPAAMSGYVSRLEKAALVARATDPDDGRRQAVSLTAEGRRVLRSVRSRRTAWLASRLGRLSPEELAAVDAAVEPLLALLVEEDAS